MSMNTAVARSEKPQLTAGGPVAALVPQSLEEAFRVAGAIAASGLAPAGLKTQEQIMVAIMAGAELGLAPFQALQSFAVVNGRPTLWGDGLVAVARAQGVKVKEWSEGDGDQIVAFCTVMRPETGEEVTRSFSVADAKKASLWAKAGPWQSYPKRMLQMRARAYALRDGCADMLRGFQIREEVEDYQPIRDVTPQKADLRSRLAARADHDEGFSAAHVSRETAFVDSATGEVIDTLDGDQIPEAFGGAETEDFPGDKPTVADLGLKTGAQLAAEKAEQEEPAFDPLAWAAEFNGDLESMDLEMIDAAIADPEARAKFGQLQAASPGSAEALDKAIMARRKALGWRAA
jgi:hypothetical protein